jgi:hypothetical protein
MTESQTTTIAGSPANFTAVHDAVADIRHLADQWRARMRDHIDQHITVSVLASVEAVIDSDAMDECRAWVHDELVQTAAWRREDDYRNIAAAELLKRMADQLDSGNFDRALLAAFLIVSREDGMLLDMLCSCLHEVTQHTGFHFWPDTVDELLREVLHRVVSPFNEALV